MTLSSSFAARCVWDNLTLEGQIEGAPENLTVQQFSGNDQAQGPHLGRAENLAVEQFAGTCHIHGVDQGRSEDLSVSEFAGSVSLKGTHRCHDVE